MLRVAALIFGVLILLIGFVGIALDVYLATANALKWDPSFRAITTFPFGTLSGMLCLWLGYRLVFTTHVNTLLPKRTIKDDRTIFSVEAADD